MNTINFEDSIFIINMRIKLIRDILCLNLSAELFLEKTLDDLQFIDHVLAVLTQLLSENSEHGNDNGEFDYLVDAEWQFDQLLIEFLHDANPFSVRSFPEIRGNIVVLRENSEFRGKLLDKSVLATEPAFAEPVVSSAELNGLLGGI